MWMAVLAFSLQALSTAPSDGLELTRFIDKVPTAQAIGKLKSGLLCGGGKLLYWRDIARPNDAESQAILEAALNGIPRPTSFDDPFGIVPKKDGQRFHIAVTIKAVKMDLCVSFMRIGERKPKGHVSLVATVATLDSQTQRRFADREITADLDFKGRDPRKDTGVYVDVLTMIATKYRATLLTG